MNGCWKTNGLEGGKNFFFVRKHLLLFDDGKGKGYFNLEDSSNDVQSILRLRGHFLLDRFQTPT